MKLSEKRSSVLREKDQLSRTLNTQHEFYEEKVKYFFVTKFALDLFLFFVKCSVLLKTNLLQFNM